MPFAYMVAAFLVTLQHMFVITGAVVVVLCVVYILTTLPELRFRGMWPCPRCEELGAFLGKCSSCGQWAPGLVVFGRWFATFFGPIIAVAVVFLVFYLFGSLRTPFLWSFLLGVPFAGLLFVAYSLLFGRRTWLCPECKEPSSFFGRCKVCGQKAPGLLHALGYFAIVCGVLIILSWVWLAADLLAPLEGGDERPSRLPATSTESSLFDDGGDAASPRSGGPLPNTTE